MNLDQAKRNVRLLQIYRALRSALFVMPVIVLFFQQNGLSQTEIFVLQSAFAVAALIMEVPSGYVADRVGRRFSLLLGAVLSTIGFGAYALAYGFWPLLVAEVFLGIGMSFMSGSDSALAYDSLRAVGREKGYRKFESRTFVYTGLASALASIAGGLIAVAGLRWTVVAQVAINALAIPVALMLVEPKRHEAKVAGRNALRDVLRVTKYALHGHQEIKWLIFYAAVVGTLTHTMIWLTQPYYQLVGIPVGWFGVLWAVQFALLALFAQLADWYERFGRAKVLASFVAIGVASYAVIGVAPSLWMLPVMIVGFAFVRAVFTPIIRDYINQLVESDVRATVLSVQSFAQKVLYIGAGPLIGWVMDVWSLQTALLFSGAFYGVLGAVVLVMMRRARLV